MRVPVGAFVAIAVLAVPLAACGDDGGSEGSLSVARYCELTAELDEAGSEAFADLENDPEATEEDFIETERQFIEDHASEIEELQRVAPDEISDDIDVMVEALQAVAAGSPEARESEDVQAAEERVLQFEDENC